MPEDQQRTSITGPVFVDWGKSGGSDDRPAYWAMLDMIAAGEVSAVFCYDDDRIARDITPYSRLRTFALADGLPVILGNGADMFSEQNRRGSDYRAIANMHNLEDITRRNKAISQMQDRRGDARGRPPYGYTYAPRKPKSAEAVRLECVNPEGIARVLETNEREGSFSAAARALNIEGHPPELQGVNPRSGRPYEWHPRTVADVVRRERPELSAGVEQGSRSRRPHPSLCRGLLRCHCGATMSPSRPGTSRVRYYCGRAMRGAHGALHYISESRLRPWIEAEAGRLRDPDEYAETVGEWDDPGLRAAIAAARAAGQAEAADMMQADYDATAAEHGERRERVLEVPAAIDFERWDTEGINRALRSLWEHVELGPDLLPVRAVWREPGLRAE